MKTQYSFDGVTWFEDVPAMAHVYKYTREVFEVEDPSQVNLNSTMRASYHYANYFTEAKTETVPKALTLDLLKAASNMVGAYDYLFNAAKDSVRQQGVDVSGMKKQSEYYELCSTLAKMEKYLNDRDANP
jgi:hypothetical protein